MSGPHPQWMDPTRLQKAGCEHGVDYAGTCYRCRRSALEGPPSLVVRSDAPIDEFNPCVVLGAN